jgi:glycosyltransferase involved in cell wall biosynthesis
MGRPLLLMLTQLPPPVHGVTVISNILVTSHVLRASFSLDVLPMRFASSVDDVDRVTLGKLLKSLTLATSVFVKCTFHRPDLVYFTLTPTGRSFFRDLLYVAILKLFRIRRAFHLHGIGVSAFANTPLRRWLYAWAFRDACIILLSPRFNDDVAAFAPRDHCRYLANGIPDPVEGAAISRASYAGPLRILFLSHMVVQKGPIILLRALSCLKRDGVPFVATFAGGRFTPDCREQFERIVTAHEMADVVTYVGEARAKEKDRLFREADVFVLPSVYDAFPLVVLEAMAYGLPVVATEQGGIPDMVLDGITGFLVPRGEDRVLAERLARLAGQPELRHRLGLASRARFLDAFSDATFEHNAATVLRSCLSGPGAPSGGTGV